MSNMEGNPMKKFTKILAFAATAALAGVLVAGCASEPAKDAGTDATDNSQKTEQAAPEGDAPAQANKLIVGYDNSYPPYGFIGDDGNPTGLDLDLAAACLLYTSVAIDFLPRIFSPGARAYFAETARTTYRILCKVIARYKDDPVFRGLFRFDPRVRELLLIPSGYEEPLPMARFDMLYSKELGRFMFCEFNTDSSSGMNETREALAALRPTPTFQRFAARHRLEDDVTRQFDGWVDTFARI